MAEVESDRLRHLDHILVKQLATFHSDGDGLARRLHNLRIAEPAASARQRPLSACDTGDAASRSRKKPGSDWDSLCGDIMKLLKLTSVITDENTRLRSLVASMEAEARTAAQQQQAPQPVASPTGRSYSELQNELEMLRRDKERLEQENAQLRQQVDNTKGKPDEEEQQKQEGEHGHLALAMEAKALSLLQEKHHLQEAECRFVSAEVSRLLTNGLAKIEQELLERRSKGEQQDEVTGCIHYILPATAVSTFVVAVAISYYTRASEHSKSS